MAFAKLMAILGFDSSAYDAGLAKAQSSAGKFAGSVKGQLASAFAGVSAATLFTKAVQKATAISDLSSKTKVTTKAIQEFDYALGQNGGTIADLEVSLKGLSKAKKEALQNPASEQMESFKIFGISSQELLEDDLMQTMKKVAAAVKTFDFGDSEQALVEKVLGKGGGGMLATFHDDLEKLIKEANDFNLVWSDGTIAALDKAGDSFDRFKNAMTIGAGIILTPILGIFDKAGTIAGGFFEGLMGQLTNDRNRLNSGADEMTKGILGVPDAPGAENIIPKSIRDARRAKKLEVEAMLEDKKKEENAAKEKVKHDKEDLQNAAKIYEAKKRLEDLKFEGRFDAVKEEQQLLMLAKKRLDLEKENKLLIKVGKKAGREGSALAGEDFYKNEEEMLKIKNQEAAIRRGMKPEPLNMSDQFSKIGLFVGGKSNVVEDALKKQIQIQTKIERNTGRPTAGRDVKF